MEILLVLLAVAAAIGFALAAVARPTLTIVPLYAAAVPGGSVVEVSLPLVRPFNTLSTLLGTAMIFAILGHVALYRRGRIPTLPVGAWAALAAWVSLSLLWASDERAAQVSAAVVWPLVLLMAAASLLRTDRRDLDVLRVAVIVSGAVIGAYAGWSLVSGGALSRADGRFVLTAGAGETDPNILAASLLLPLAFSLERLVLGGTRWWPSSWWRALGAAGAALTLVGVASTGSRGGLLAAAAIFGGVLVVCRHHPGAGTMIRRTLATLVLVAVALVSSAAVAIRVDPGGPVHRLLTRPPLGRIAETQLGGSGRLEIWQTGSQLCAEHCAVGAGLGSFPFEYNRRFAFSGVVDYPGVNRPAHSIFIDIAVENGLPALTLLLVGLLAEWRSLGAARRTAPSLRPLLLGVVVANVFLSTLWFKYVWLAFTVNRLAEGVDEAAPAEDPAPAAQPVAQPAPV